MVYCDANVILRYLLKDNKEYYLISRDLIEKRDIFLPNEVTAEIVYVLLKTYAIEKKHVCGVLKELFSRSNIYFNSKTVILSALDIFFKNSLDFVDCILCAYNIIEGREIMSFDKKVNKLIKRKAKSNESESRRTESRK